MFDEELEKRFVKNYPEFCHNGKPLSPYYDFWEAGAEFGHNNANEWHYVKDGLPKELHDVLCFVIHNEHRFVLQGYLRDGRWVLSPLGTYLNNDDVIAWKEIVLPKEIK